MKLYEYGPTRSARCRWMLQELAVPFEAVEVDLPSGEHRRPAFLALNPLGRVPVLVDDELVVTESVAICLYLGDKYADRGLVPVPGTAERAKHDQWLLFCATELEQPLWRIRRHTSLYPKDKRLPAEVEIARDDFKTAARVLADALEGKTYLVGDRFTAADIVTAYTLSWAGWYDLLADFAPLQAYLDEHLKRPSCPAALQPQGQGK